MGRLGLALLVLWLVSVLVFWGSQVLPGDVAQLALGQYATPEAVATLREQMGLNQPVIQQYAHWLAGMLHGDWRVSLSTGTTGSAMPSGRSCINALMAVGTVSLGSPLAVGTGGLMGRQVKGSYGVEYCGDLCLSE